ncbi:hypothetical protein KUH03_21450 [Sphingobacterium sp. E70]|uniref:hypothetical protein n=1 Tax=Sphingobacterium sp. E70 TaxID=2853439 RepID=UPI00211CF8DC|nr:hypothetical protein [Sphingobacterium sp. E70]ULT22093.1 hypothetical protein KUH03_21450 [Sphingobacterium sp. E70]
MRKRFYLIVVAVLMLMSGCKKYLDINENPSNPQLVKAELLLAPIIAQMASGYSQDQRQMNKFNQTILGGSSDVSSKIWEKHGFPERSDVGVSCGVWYILIWD